MRKSHWNTAGPTSHSQAIDDAKTHLAVKATIDNDMSGYDGDHNSRSRSVKQL